MPIQRKPADYGSLCRSPSISTRFFLFLKHIVPHTRGFVHSFFFISLIGASPKLIFIVPLQPIPLFAYTPPLLSLVDSR